MRTVLILVLLTMAAGLGYVAYEGIAPRQAATAAPAPIPTVRVLVAAAPLHPGTLLKDQDIRERALPPGDVPDGALLATQEQRDELRGAMLRRYLGPGEQVTREDVLRPRDRGFLAAVLRPGMRAVAIGVDARTGAAGLIFPGDLVDVILTQTFSGADASIARRVTAETVLTGVRVIAVDQMITQGAIIPSGSARPTEQVARTVTVEVSPEQSERLAVAERLGQLILALRPIDAPDGDQAARPTTTVFGADVSPALSSTETPAMPRMRVIQGGNVNDVIFR
ncbi:Flp pilus assembly protein CpaB [Falsiroseomonas oryziterrae]|uniref:Flp pilus assembly protein CpaB n=1 Tax=Falsiroseomonas oryziterrae TaxID=2911368 RepID=UPI001F419141|nr:Flp pilus assembly protein CpaB [Roseomonas sp. NPKOSM-4]